MTPPIHVRRMTLDDLPAICSIQARAYPPDLHESADSLDAKRQASPATCFVAESPAADGGAGRSVHGYLLALPRQDGGPLPLHQTLPDQLDGRPTLSPTLYLHDLAVDPPAQSQGVGLALLHAFEAAREHSGRQAAALTAVQGSAVWWQRFGFAPAALSAEQARHLAGYAASQGVCLQRPVCPWWQLADSELSRIESPAQSGQAGCWRLHFSVAAVSGWPSDTSGPTLSGYLRRLVLQLDGVHHAPQAAALAELIYGRLGSGSRIVLNGRSQPGLPLWPAPQGLRLHTGPLRLELELPLGGRLDLEAARMQLAQPLDASAFGEAMSC